MHSFFDKKPTSLRTALQAAILGGSVAALLLRPTPADAASLYWDSNGTDPGAGVTPNGTWGIDPFWNLFDANVPANTPTTILDIVTFSAGADATGSYTVTVNGTQTARVISIEDGAPTFAGGTIALGAPGLINSGGNPILGLVVADTAGNPICLLYTSDAADE